MHDANRIISFNMFVLAMHPHGSCYLWDSRLVTLHALADFATAIAYFLIPAFLWTYRKQAPSSLQPVLWLFVTFIMSCGLGHLIDVWNIWHANY